MSRKELVNKIKQYRECIRLGFRSQLIEQEINRELLKQRIK